MPPRSTGCATCRERKIRCDETRPQCTRCQVYGVVCGGYRTDEPGGTEFRNVSLATAQKAQSQYDRRRDESGALASSSSTSDGGPEQIDPTSRIEPPNATLRDGEFNRTVFWKEFLDNHVPKECDLQCDQHCFFRTCMGLSTTQPALLHGLDALSLVQIGSVNNDKRLLDQANQKYAEALRDLHRALSQQELLRDDHVLAAVMVMKAWKFYSEIASSRGVGWGEHIRGVQNILTARGPASFQSELALELYVNARNGALCHSLLIRKAPAFAHPSWRRVAERTGQRDQSSALNGLAIQVPGILERYDALDLDMTQIDDVLADAALIERDLRSWMSRWESQHETRPIGEFANFTSLCSDPTFDIAHMFPNFVVASLHSTYWICMYFIRITIRALHTARAIVGRGYIEHPDQIVREEEILGYILNMCHCIPYFCEPASASTGTVSIFLPLRTAALYFVEHSMWSRATWIGNVRRTVMNKGLAPPSIDDMDIRDCRDLIGTRVDQVTCFLRK